MKVFGNAERQESVLKYTSFTLVSGFEAFYEASVNVLKIKTLIYRTTVQIFIEISIKNVFFLVFIKITVRFFAYM